MRRLLALSIVLGTPSARAADDTFGYDLRIDVPVTAAMAVGLVGIAVFRQDLAADACHWCEPGSFDAGVQDALRWSDGGPAATTSDVLLVALPVLSASALALDGWRDDRAETLGVDGLVFAEAVLAAQVVNQVVKLSAARTRPYASDLPVGERPTPDAQDIASFYSGHTSTTFSMVVAAGTIAALRGGRSAAWIFAIGLPLAALTGLMRIAADRHWATDVVAGAAMGSAFGFGIPWIHAALR